MDKLFSLQSADLQQKLEFAFEQIDGSQYEDSVQDQLKSSQIRDLIKDDYDNEESLSRKSEKINYLKELVRLWSREIAINAKIAEENISKYEAKLLPFGSYYLEASSKQGDIDMVVVASQKTKRKEDFEKLYEKLCKDKRLENCNMIAEAKIPIISFNFLDDGQEIDISLAVLEQDTIPEDIETNIEKYDEKLKNLEKSSQQSLNGRRDNSFIRNNCGQRKDVFKDAVKFIKQWTKSKGVFENKMGYFAGISYVIMIAKVCQLFPYYPLNQIIEIFFEIYSNWDWSKKITINKPSGQEEPEKIIEKSLMQIMTPAHPQSNSMKAIQPTFRVMVDQLKWTNEQIREMKMKNKEIDFAKLLQNEIFFDKVNSLIQIDIAGVDQNSFYKFQGKCLVKFLNMFKNMDNLLKQYNISIYPFPKHFKKQRPKYTITETYFIGLRALEEAKLEQKILLNSEIVRYISEITNDKMNDKMDNEVWVFIQNLSSLLQKEDKTLRRDVKAWIMNKKSLVKIVKQQIQLQKGPETNIEQEQQSQQDKSKVEDQQNCNNMQEEINKNVNETPSKKNSLQNNEEMEIEKKLQNQQIQNSSNIKRKQSIKQQDQQEKEESISKKIKTNEDEHDEDEDDEFDPNNL